MGRFSKTPIYTFVAGKRRNSHAAKTHPDHGIRRALSRDEQIREFTPNAFAFWRNLLVLFCIFSVVGHWLECIYCLVMDVLFHVIEEGFTVWDDPMYPYLVYGIATVVCVLVLMPLKVIILERRKTLWGAVLELFVISVLICLIMELAMGFMLNQPDPITGEYPLWDNSKLPLNVLGQAWLVNDFFLGLLGGLYIWVIYPLCLGLISLVPHRIANIGSVAIVAGFVVLCICKFS